jgi:hypothetical protein
LRKQSILRSIAGLLLVAVLGSVALTTPLRDFVEYWSVGHVFLRRQNPYSLPVVFAFETELGWPEPIPLMVLNPPWILPLLAPLGFFTSYPLAWLLWVAMLAGATCLSSFLLVKLYADDVRLPEISDTPLLQSLLIFSFFPVLLSLRFAQISPLILLGLTGFLWLQKRGNPFLAGSALTLAALKPQLLYLVFLAVLADAIQRRQWRVIAGFAGSLAVLSSLGLLWQPRAFADYLELLRTPYPQVYPSAVGAILRAPFGEANTFWIQFVPMIAGLAWFVRQWEKQKANWDWIREAPILVAVSILTSAYGWLFDQALLAVPIVALFAVCARKFGSIPLKVVLAYSAINLVAIFGAILPSFHSAYLVAPISFILAVFLAGILIA